MEQILEDVQSQEDVNLLDVPPEMRGHIAVLVRYDDLMNLCKTSKEIMRSICQDNVFWKNKTEHDFGQKYDIERHPDGWEATYQYYRGVASFELIADARAGNLEKVKEFLNSGFIEVNFQDEDGLTALIEASLHSHTEIVKLLLENGANPIISDDNEITALSLSANRGHTEIVRILLEAGADLNFQDDGWFAELMMSSDGVYPVIVMILLEAGDDP